MARSSSTLTAPAPKTKAAAQLSSARHEEGWRETVEAIVVAFILALLVRGFVAEAFVIPTGSMAPTLMGRHKEVDCPQCGYVYSVNAAEEAEGLHAGTPEGRVASGICLNCRYQYRLAKEPSFKGDRILVMKFPYELPRLPLSSGPKRWDVMVFRYPEKPEESYIKRLVGLPGDTVRIWYGDISIKPAGSREFHQEHRPLYHQQAMQMMVYDDHHRPKALKDRPEWQRWVSTDGESWAEETATPGSFVAKSNPDTWAELRYRHLVPDPVQWNALEANETPARAPKPNLITDFYSYNTNLSARASDLTAPRPDGDSEYAWNQSDWVGDLTLSAKVNAQGTSGKVRFELIEGGVSNRAEVDLATGIVTVFHGEEKVGEAGSSLKAGGSHDVRFANVDNRLTLWVDNATVFGDGLIYSDPDPNRHPDPTIEDLSPARIASQGAEVRVSDLVLKRDIYYTLNPGRIDYSFGRSWDDPKLPRNPVELAEMLADPARVAAFSPLSYSDYPVSDNGYLMLGDNSPRSKDSRAWSDEDKYDETNQSGWDHAHRERWEVPRKMLTGKAFSVYWPHGKPFGPDIHFGSDFRIPFRPYFERMKWIR